MPQLNRAACAALASLLVFLLAACTPTAEQPAAPPPPPPPPKPPVAVIEEYSIAKHPICFSSGSAKIEQSADQALIDMAVWLKAHAKVTITIEGHTDERGTREYDLALAQARADAVRGALGKLGIARKRVKVVGYGAERPLVAGYSDEARQQNRCAVAVIDPATKG